ncbi:MAG: antibiotic biosynthesis monooxygenase [Acidobacteriota bacterium]|nr:antibiotic biosynthesis monooxygenase [Acidobacteriota bacterium]
MSTIHVTARATIHAGKLEDFKALAAKCVELVCANEPGALEYSWYLNDAQTECVVCETYKDSDAVLAHIANVGKTLAALGEVADWTFEICGEPSAELAQATAAMPLKVYRPLQGK